MQIEVSLWIIYMQNCVIQQIISKSRICVIIDKIYQYCIIGIKSHICVIIDNRYQYCIIGINLSLLGFPALYKPTHTSLIFNSSSPQTLHYLNICLNPLTSISCLKTQHLTNKVSKPHPWLQLVLLPHCTRSLASQWVQVGMRSRQPTGGQPEAATQMLWP